MDGSVNAPVSTIPPPISKCSHSPGVLDENEQCYDQIAFSNIKSSTKSPSPTRHYMSPTISAASKAALPRKKILGERNGVPDVEQIVNVKPFNLSPKISSPRCSINGHIDVKSCSPVPSIVEAKTSANESSIKPYDPVTNYLSQRPQFLRYNPNRRSTNSLHPENEYGERRDGFDAQRGLSFVTQKPAFDEALGEDNHRSSISCSEEDEKTDNENAEDDTQESSVFSPEVDIEEGSSVISSEEDHVKKEFLKTFNGNAESYHVHEMIEEEDEVFEDERSWSLKGVSQFLLVMVSLIFLTHYISSMNSPRLMDTSEAVWDFKTQHHKYHFETRLNISEGTIEPTSLWGDVGLLKSVHGGISDGFEEEFVIRDDQKLLIDITYELCEMEVEAQEMHTEDVGGIEETTDKVGLPHTEAAEAAVQVLESIDKASDQVEVFEIEKAEEVSDELQASEATEMHENENNSGLGSDDENMGIGGDRIEPMEEVPDQLVEDDVERVQDTGNNEHDTGNVESGLSQEADSTQFVFPKANLDSIQVAAIVVPIIFTILASLGIVYYLRQKKNVLTEESCPVVEPLVEPAVPENISQQPPTIEEEKSEGAYFLASTSNLVHEVEAAADISHSHFSYSHQSQSHAPSVELLGERVVGEVSSSRRSYTVRSRNSEKENSNKDSPSQSKIGSFVEASEGFSHAKTTSLDFSAVDSTTVDGSSTAEKKKRGKGGAGEETTPVRRSSSKVLPSPVRRSSRLRAMSP